MAFGLIEKQVIYDGVKIRLELHHLEDDRGRRLKREVCVHPGAVVILPILPDGRIQLIRVRRYAVGQILLELPAGTLESGESPMNCAGRELQEETGYLAGRLESIGAFYSSPGILSEKLYAFAAYDLQMTRVAREAGEEIEMEPPTLLADALDMIRLGQIADSKTIATLMMYDRFFERDRTDAPRR